MNSTCISIQEAINILPDAVLLVDRYGNIVASNDQVEPIFGYAPAELVGQDLSVLLPERFRSKHYQHIQKYFDNPGTERMGKGAQYIAKRKNGEESDVDLMLSPITLDDKTYVVAAVRDISELMQLERMLLHRNEQLSVINQELDRLGYIIAHDLKSPLLNLHAQLNMLKRALTEEQKQLLADHFHALDHTMQSTLNLITGVAEYSRAATTEQKEEQVDLNDLIQEACALINFPENTMLDIAPDLPVINGNKTKLLQVFLNLISNAVKYNDKDVLKIAIRLLDKKDVIVITVSDNGPGVPPEFRRKIFELLWKGHIKRDDSHGIGLAVVKKIIQDRGGNIIVVDSRLGGADFIFSWPLKKVQQDPLGIKTTIMF